MKEFTVDAKNAVLNHHERPAGQGFPKGLNEKQISAIDGFFIICSHFAHELIVQGTSPSSINNLKEYFKSRYNVGNYQDTISAFSKVFR